MIPEIERRKVFGALDMALREVFPDEYGAKCYYAAMTLGFLLREHGVRGVNIVAGSLIFPTFSGDRIRERKFWSGFTDKPSEDLPPHVWIETPDHPVIDISTIYLSTPEVASPAIWWSESTAPYWIDGYRAIASLSYDLSGDDGMGALVKAYNKHAGSILLDRNILSTKSDYYALAKQGDPWCKFSRQYQNTLQYQLPRLVPLPPA